jgi:hypothetical protein
MLRLYGLDYEQKRRHLESLLDGLGLDFIVIENEDEIEKIRRIEGNIKLPFIKDVKSKKLWTYANAVKHFKGWSN